MQTSVVQEYRRNISVDGYTYQLSVQFSRGTLPEHMLLHSHSRYELHAVLEGDAVIEFEGRSAVAMNTGDCCILAPHIYHLRRINSMAGRYVVVFINRIGDTPLLMQDLVWLRCAPELIQLLRRLEQEMGSCRIGRENVAQSLLTLFLVTVLRELTAPLPHHVPTAGNTVGQREDLIDNYFAKHYGSETSAEDLAEKLGLTTRQLARIMQKRYGCTFRQHLWEIRMYHARVFLTTTDMPISVIANTCGFSDQGAFATAFRKCVGCAPTQFRREKRC